MQVMYTYVCCVFQQTNTLGSVCWLCFSSSSEDILGICPPRSGSSSGERARRQTGSLGGAQIDEVEIMYV